MQQEAIQKAAIVRNDALKESIKKTVEKYYNVQKKTNGYIPE
jgi:ribosomal protein L23